jgi:hypothetical protein
MTAPLGFAAVEAIREGALDRHLDTIDQAIQARRRVLRRSAAPGRTPEMVDNHQHWVWINGPGEPHWEIRGTGVAE